MRCADSHRRAISQGFTLIEVLIALMILAMGLLGSLSLVIDGLRANRHALHETLAATLVADLADRIRANRAAATAYALDEDSVLTAPPQHCAAVGECSPSDVAALSLYEWQHDALASLPEATTSVQVAPVDTGETHRVTITIRWTQTGADAKAAFSLTVQT